MSWCEATIGRFCSDGMPITDSSGRFFHTPSGTYLGIMTAALYMPGMVISFPASMLANQFGRLPALWTGNFLLIAGALFTTFSQTGAQYIGGKCLFSVAVNAAPADRVLSSSARALLGCGVATVKVVAPALVQEYAHPRLRPVLGSMYYGFYYTGAIASGILCIGGLYINSDWSWRMPLLCQVVGPIIATSITLRAYDSPRFLVKKGKVDDAHEFLASHHANGVRDDPLVLFELHEIQAALDREEECARSSFLDFLKTPGNRRRLRVILIAGFGINWQGNGLVSHYLSPVLKSVGITSPTQITSINAGLAVWNLIMAWGAASQVERFGRRFLFFTSGIGMFLSYAAVMGLSAGFANTGSASMGIAVIPFLFIYYAFYDFAWTPLPWFYVPEVIPYTLRTKGLALLNLCSNIGK